MTSIAGVGSNLDVDTIVSQLMTVERRPLNLLAAAATKTQAKLSAFAQLKSLVSTLQSTLAGLDASKFSALTATVADPSIASVTAAAGASEGRHSLEVLTLAESQKLKSGTFSSTGDPVGTGKLTFDFGRWDGATFTPDANRASTTVSIAPGQDTLAGVRDAINAAKAGVTAAIVDDGSGPRLVVASSTGGTASTMRVSVQDDDGANGDATGLSSLAYDPAAAAGAGRNLSEASAAVDATFRLDGILVTRGTNTVSDALDGVTLTLAKQAPGSPTSFTISRDTATAQSAAQTFVKAWNDVNTTLATLTKADPTGKTTGTLQGDSIALAIGSRLRSVLSSAAPGLGNLRSLSQVGISVQKDGSLALDSAKLSSALASDPSGVAALFGAVGKASDARVAFVGSTSSTQAGAHALVVTQAATHGSLAGSAPAGLTITAGVDDTLTVRLDGVTATVQLTAKTYASADELAAEVQRRVNGAPALVAAGLGVDVGASGGVVTLSSRSYGSGSTVAASGTAATGLLGGNPGSAVGLDIAGTIDGVAATGSGRTLTAATGSTAEGLRVRVDSSATGAFGALNFSRGYADLLSRAAGDFVATGGGIASRIDGLNATLKLNQKRQDETNDRLADTEKRLRAQFTALDTLMSKMNQTSAFLTQQLASLPRAGG